MAPETKNGGELKRWRERAGLTTSDAERTLGLRSGKVAYYETLPLNSIAMSTLHALTRKVYNVPPREIQDALGFNLS